MDRWLTEARKSLIVGTFVTVFTGVLAVLCALWLVAALAVGSWSLALWLGGR
jgi:hypothetical protein